MHRPNFHSFSWSKVISVSRAAFWSISSSILARRAIDLENQAIPTITIPLLGTLYFTWKHGLRSDWYIWKQSFGLKQDNAVPTITWFWWRHTTSKQLCFLCRPAFCQRRRCSHSTGYGRDQHIWYSHKQQMSEQPSIPLRLEPFGETKTNLTAYWPLPLSCVSWAEDGDREHLMVLLYH